MIIRDLKQFKADRDKALFSLDETKIRAFLAKYDMPMAESKAEFWGAVYKALYNMPHTPLPLKYEAIKGLRKLGMDTGIIEPVVEMGRTSEEL